MNINVIYAKLRSHLPLTKIHKNGLKFAKKYVSFGSTEKIMIFERKKKLNWTDQMVFAIISIICENIKLFFLRLLESQDVL